jgi:hypothetical protein
LTFLRVAARSAPKAAATKAANLLENSEQWLKKKVVQRSVVHDAVTEFSENIPRLRHKAMRHKP